jgi:RimJ/RimL family protein N-acetyltransferase
MKKTEQSSIVFLRGKKTTLRPIEEKDIPLFLKWMNSPEMRYYLNRVLPITEKIEKAWLENLYHKKETEIALIIEVKGVPIGVMSIHGISWKDRAGTTGAAIWEPKNWNKGFGTDAKMVLLDYAFNSLNLRKIESVVVSYNKRSLAYSLHCGYKIEGRLRKNHFKNGRYHDEIILGLFKHEWLPYWKKYCQK